MNAIEARAWDEAMQNCEALVYQLGDGLETLAEGVDECDVEQMAKLLRLASVLKVISNTITESMVESVTK